jgi:hypothetical protein
MLLCVRGFRQERGRERGWGGERERDRERERDEEREQERERERRVCVRARTHTRERERRVFLCAREHTRVHTHLDVYAICPSPAPRSTCGCTSVSPALPQMYPKCMYVCSMYVVCMYVHVYVYITYLALPRAPQHMQMHTRDTRAQARTHVRTAFEYVCIRAVVRASEHRF